MGGVACLRLILSIRGLFKLALASAANKRKIQGERKCVCPRPAPVSQCVLKISLSVCIVTNIIALTGGIKLLIITNVK